MKKSAVLDYRLIFIAQEVKAVSRWHTGFCVYSWQRQAGGGQSSPPWPDSSRVLCPTRREMASQVESIVYLYDRLMLSANTFKFDKS